MRNKILDIAEEMFRNKGYKAVNLSQIANSLGIKKPSLYYYFPNGKEEIFLEVNKRKIEYNNLGIIKAINEGQNIIDKLKGLVTWFTNQPPMRMTNLMFTDIANVSTETAEKIELIVFKLIFKPISDMLQDSISKNEITDKFSPETITGTILAAIEGSEFAPNIENPQVKNEMLHSALNILLWGIIPRKKE